MAVNPTLTVRVLSPKGVVYTGSCRSVSSENTSGKFDILPQHSSFLTLVENKTILIQTSDGKSITLNLPLAIIHNLKNTVSIYTDILPK